MYVILQFVIVFVDALFEWCHSPSDVGINLTGICCHEHWPEFQDARVDMNSLDSLYFV